MASTNGEYSTVLGPDAHFKGELQFEKGARLLGSFEGQIQTKGEFLVADGAKLSGEVRAANIKLDGSVKGNLHATEKIQLSASAKLEGDLKTARLEVADGAVFVGQCFVGPASANGSPSSPQHSNNKAPQQQDDASKGRNAQPEPVAAKK
jgi:cytoskeletal protein CcmA (bactofilin family)